MKILTALLACALLPLAHAADQPIDEKLAAKAAVVVRAQRLSVDGAEKYALYRVKVLAVLKNAPGAKLPDALTVGAYSWKDGVPEGECTLYLERYNAANPDPALWKLVGGDAATGVSHARKP